MADIATIANELKSGKTVLYIGMWIFNGYSFSDGSSVCLTIATQSFSL